MKEIKNQFGVTVNDVVMALCSGALRRYLAERKELPADPLIAMVPVSIRTEAQQGSYGNQVSAMTASLHTHIEDPLTRLERIHESMLIAKEKHKALPANLLQDFAQFAPPAVAARAARVIARATCHAGQTLTADAEAIFIAVDFDEVRGRMLERREVDSGS